MFKHKLFFSCISLFLSVVYVHAQESLFKGTMKNPRPAGARYKWTNQKDKMVKLDKVKAYAQKNNILLGAYTTIEIGRFGDAAISLKTLEFLPMSEYADYIMEKILDDTPIASFKSKGSFLYYDPRSKTQLFQLLGDAFWTGSLVNGRIDGQGAGVKQMGTDFYIAFNGLFHEGVPVGRVVYYTYRPKEPFGKYDGKYRTSKTAEMGTVFSEDRISIRYDMKYGFINKEGDVPVMPEFDDVSPFHNGVATAQIGNIQIEIDNLGKPLRVKEGSDYDLRALLFAKQMHSSLYTAIENTLRDHIQSFGYDDLATISKEFPALAETAQSAVKKNGSSYQFQDLVKLENDFPALADFAHEHKMGLYKADCIKLLSAYENAVAAAKENRINTDDYDIVSSFIYDYGELYKFDPDNQLSVAKNVMAYYDICRAFSFKPNEAYCTLSSDPPVFYAEFANSDLDLVTNAWFKCNSASEDFRSFADFARPRIEYLGNQLNSALDKQYYSQYTEAFNLAKGRAYQNLSSLKSYNDLKPYIEDVDTWEVEGTYDNSIFGGSGKLMSSQQTTVYRFKDGIKIIVAHYWDSPGWTSNPKSTYQSLQVVADRSFDYCIVNSYKMEKERLLQKEYEKTSFFLRHFPWMD